MELSVVLVADTNAPSVQAAVEHLAAAVDDAEATGATVQVVVVDSSDDPLVKVFLGQVEGAEVLAAPGLPHAEALLLGAREAQAPVLWLSGTDAAPAPSSLTRLAAAVTAGAELALAGGDDPAPFCALRRSSLDRLADVVSSGGADVDAVPALAAALLEEGRPVTAVTGAGTVRSRQRESRPMDGGTRLTLPLESFRVGPASYSGPNSLFRTFGGPDTIEVGGYCSIADEVRLLLPGERVFDAEGNEVHLTRRGTHRMDAASSFPMGILVPDEDYEAPGRGCTGERLVVEDDVWIGYRATVIGGITIGCGAVVGAGAVVVADVPPYAVVGGVPARVIRMRFDDETVQRLTGMRWWDWPPAVVRGAHRWFSRPVAQFLRHFDPAGEVGVVP